jgi:hypothetical protein
MAAALLLSGCGSFLDREYTVTAPHSSTYFSSEDRSVLRVENYQDLVNGLLMLINSRAAEGTVWLYPGRDVTDTAEATQRACREVQQETPLGSYAVSYLTYTIDDTAHNYSEVRLTLGYRRTAEQVSAMVHATSVSALYDLLTAVARSGGRELVIQVSYFDQTREEVRAAVEQLQLELFRASQPPQEDLTDEPEASTTETGPDGEVPDGESPDGETPNEVEPELGLPDDVTPWQVNFYPAEGDVGIVEVLLQD